VQRTSAECKKNVKITPKGLGLDERPATAIARNHLGRTITPVFAASAKSSGKAQSAAVLLGIVPFSLKPGFRWLGGTVRGVRNFVSAQR